MPDRAAPVRVQESVEITPAMIEAGADALLAYDLRDLARTLPHVIVAEVYRAMVRHAPRHPFSEPR